MKRSLRSLLSTSSLGFRLGSTLVLALLPLGILSVLQTQSAQSVMEETTLEGIAGASRLAVQPQIELIRDAQVSVRVLAAALSSTLQDDANCNRRVAAVAATIPKATVVTYIPLSGQVTCASNGRFRDVSTDPSFLKLSEKPLPRVVYSPMGPVSGTAVIGVGHPVFDDTGRHIGVAVISLPYIAVAPKDYADEIALWQPRYLATFSSDGTLLISSDATIDPVTILPTDFVPQQIAQYSNTTEYSHSHSGREILSVTSVADDLFLLAIWSRDNDGYWSRVNAISPYLIPVLTWIAALIAASLASGGLVVRHVRALSSAMSDYMTDRTRREVPDIDDAPAEIQRLHAAYDQLITTIARDEADLENLLVDKDQLLREVNHRSGNSLQVIASVMRMYRRETTDENLRHVLDGLINRVIALSSTHTSLYSMSGRRDVPMDEILAGVVRRLKEIHGVALGVAKKQFQPIRMPAEAAIPLALALAEIVSCLFSARTVATEGVDIVLAEEGDRVRLSVTGPVVPEFQPETTSGLTALPRRMLMQFSAQLRGTLIIRIEDGRSKVDFNFPRLS